MREVAIGDGESIKLKGSTMTLFHFEQEFDEDMMAKLSDLAPLIQNADNLGQRLEAGDFGALKGFKSMTILRYAWAMNKTANKNIQSFKPWLEKHQDTINPFDADVLEPIVKELTKGCFRGSGVDAKISPQGEQPDGRTQSSNDDNQ